MGNTIEKPNIEEIMTRIRKEVREELERHGERIPHYIPPSESGADEGRTPLLYSEELNYLNSHWHDWSPQVQVSSHRKILGPIIVKIKRLFVDAAWKYLLRDYMEREKQFQMNLVRHLNSTARYIDKRNADLFWQQIHKIDSETRSLNERIDRLYDETSANSSALEFRVIQQLDESRIARDQVKRFEDELNTVKDLVRGLERTIAVLNSSKLPPAFATSSETPSTPRAVEGLDYLLLENRFRGSEETIAERVAGYLPFFKSATLPVIECGCGRGEFLSMLLKNNIPARGVDLNEAMVLRAMEQGLPVELGDCLEYLQKLPDRSIGGIFAAQVIEHLTREQLERFISLAAKKIAIGGRVIFETINPGSVKALAQNFFRDPTHIWPLHPDTVAYMMELKGIKNETVLMRSPYSAGDMLQPVPENEHLPARWQTTIQTLNRNVATLNELLFGYMDYAVVGLIER